MKNKHLLQLRCYCNRYFWLLFNQVATEWYDKYNESLNIKLFQRVKKELGQALGNRRRLNHFCLEKLFFLVLCRLEFQDLHFYKFQEAFRRIR